MATQLNLSDLVIDVVQKDIKNVHLSVYPPAGRVRISAPNHMSIEKIRLFAISKLSWIRLQQKKLKNQERETAREYLDRESHYLWGERLLQLEERDDGRTVELKHRTLSLSVAPKTTPRKRELILQEWYWKELKSAIPEVINRWERRMDVKVLQWGVKRMKTRWGSCNPSARRIWINLELIKKPSQCLDYIVVHEMVHLLERRHNDKFVAHMDRLLPNWRSLQQLLNSFPLRHERWGY